MYTYKKIIKKEQDPENGQESTWPARGDSGIPVYPKKIRQNIPKYPRLLPIYPKLIKAL